MESREKHCRIALALSLLLPPAARAMDLRFDVATEASGTSDNNQSYFTASHLPALDFPSVNGHNVEQSNANRLSTIAAAGNSLGMYYNSYNTLFPTDTAAQAVTAINSYLTASSRFGSSANSRFLVLNEIDAATWQGSSGDAYRTWITDTLTGLHNLGYNNIILFSPRYLASKTYASSFQTIANYAYIGLESYLDGYTIKNSYNYNLAQVQAYYQGYYNSWTSTTNGPGVPASRLFAGEHFGVYTHNYVAGQYFGSNGISGADWQAAIQIRDIAIHNIPFGGFIGYLWYRNLLATGDDATDLATQLSYERAYASTLAVQSEVPTWTGNAGTTNTWSDGFNWTGGLPSTTQAPYPLLASTNPTLPKQTTANFFNTIKASTVITLDGNQSVTRLAFDSPFTYTLTPGNAGTLTLTGPSASLAVLSGTHAITAPLTIASNTAASLTGNLTLFGPLTLAGTTLTKSGAGTLTISGPQSHAANSTLAVTAGTLNLNSDAGPNLSLTATGGTTNLNAPQHLASLTLSGAASVNLAGNPLTLTSIPAETLRQYLLAGQLRSSLADPTHALGYAPTAAASLLVKLTYYGDANLDGTVNADDYALLDRGFAQHATTWYQGDFNYDGIINSQDYLLIDATYLSTHPASPAFLAQRESQFGETYVSELLAAVPEPSAALACGFATPTLLTRRRHKRD